MPAPTVIKWTDANAPVLNNATGRAIELWDFITSKLGWTKEFSGLNKAVYRPSSGTRKFYRIDDTVSGTYQGTYKFKISTYDSMSDIDSGAGLVGPCWCYKSWNGGGVVNSDAKPWFAIGDGAGFLLITKPFPTYIKGEIMELNYFGDGIPLFSSDQQFAVITGPTTDVIATSEMLLLNNPLSASSAKASIRASRNIDVSLSNVAGCLMTNGGLHVGMVMGTKGPVYPYDGKLLYSRPLVNDGAAYSMRGFIPGLYSPEHSSGLTDGATIDIDGYSFMVFKGYDYNNVKISYFLVDIGEGFR